jgi:hypothetical protein
MATNATTPKANGTELGSKLANALKASDTPKATPKAAKDTNSGPNEKWPFGIKIEGTDGNISWERFKTAKERDQRQASIKGKSKRVDYQLNPTDAKAAPKPKAAPKAAAPKAAKAESKPKSAPKAAPNALDIHINKTGRVCFSKTAADRLGEAKYVAITIDKRTVRFEPLAKEREGAVPVRDGGGRPYISATKQLKTLGFDGSKPYDIEAKPLNAHGFEFTL